MSKVIRYILLSNISKMKTAQGGYKAMIRDRVPQTVDAALKWCKAKNKWIEHVYYHFVWFLVEKKDRNCQVRSLMGLAKYSRGFNFEDTIDWYNLDKEEAEYWNSVKKGVHWFEQNTITVVETWKTKKLENKTDEQTKEYICSKLFKDLTPDWREKLYQHYDKFIFPNYS